MTQAITPRSPSVEISYEAYLTLPMTRQPTEVIEGVLVVMNPPTTSHQIILGNLNWMIRGYVSTHDLGVVLLSPLDLVIRKRPKLKVRQPDLMFFSDAKAGYRIRSEQARFKAELPVPALAVEVLSPEQIERTMAGKLADYAEHGIDEVWFVDQDQRSIRVLNLDGPSYRLTREYREGDRLASNVIAGLDLDLTSGFEL